MKASSRLPRGKAIFLDHLAHWVPDIHAAAALLDRLGFVTTPYAEHGHADGDTTVPAGSANQCVMLEEGYLEVLTPIGDTPIAREVRAALARYTGVHLAAFCAADAEAHRRRLVAAGFAQRPSVTLSRRGTTAAGEACTLRFTVVRPEVDCLAEGRVQFLTHHTPDELWQARWLEHPNTARALTDLLFCVADPREAGPRYERYLGRRAESVDGGSVLEVERGRLTLLDAEHVRAALPGIHIPCVPFMAAYAVACESLGKARALLHASGIEHLDHGRQVLSVAAPAALGGTVVFTQGGAPPPWL
jgi:Glyoxalase-like domain